MNLNFRSAIGAPGLLALIIASGIATAQPPAAPRAEGPVFVPPGSSWVMAVRESGSFGSSSRQGTVRARGEQTWSARKVIAYENEGATTLLLDPATMSYVARLRGSAPVESWDPPTGWTWPLWVGKSWTQNYRYTNHAAGRTSFVQGWYKVEAYEEVKVPAGTFGVFRVAYSDGYTEVTNWWSPEFGFLVKSRTQRTPSHSAGPGVRETELVSHDIKR